MSDPSSLLATRPALTLPAARAVLAAAREAALRHGHAVCIAVLDDGGHLVCLERLDGTQIGSIEIAILKARTAVAFRRGTAVFQDAVDGGRPTLLCLPGAIPLDGGVPLAWRGEVLGAIGVSGADEAGDGAIARAGAAVLG